MGVRQAQLLPGCCCVCEMCMLLVKEITVDKAPPAAAPHPYSLSQWRDWYANGSLHIQHDPPPSQCLWERVTQSDPARLTRGETPSKDCASCVNSRLQAVKPHLREHVQSSDSAGMCARSSFIAMHSAKHNWLYSSLGGCWNPGQRWLLECKELSDLGGTMTLCEVDIIKSLIRRLGELIRLIDCPGPWPWWLVCQLWLWYFLWLWGLSSIFPSPSSGKWWCESPNYGSVTLMDQKEVLVLWN